MQDTSHSAFDPLFVTVFLLVTLVLAEATRNMPRLWRMIFMFAMGGVMGFVGVRIL